jgi:hypothetical protein
LESSGVAGTGYGSNVDTICFDRKKMGGDTIKFTDYISLGSKNVFIDGGNNQIVLSGNNSTYLFLVSDSAAFFTMSNLTLTAGYTTTSGSAGAMRITSTRPGGIFRLNTYGLKGIQEPLPAILPPVHYMFPDPLAPKPPFI